MRSPMYGPIVDALRGVQPNTLDNSTSDLFAEFVRDLQTGKVMYMAGIRKYRNTTCKPDVSAAIFDFDYLFDVRSPIASGEMGREINERCVEAILSGDFRLPFPRVWYFYRCRDAENISDVRINFCQPRIRRTE
jgi:hypothetical protein